MPRPRLKEITEAVKTKIHTIGGFAELPNIRLIVTVIKVNNPISISVQPKNIIPASRFTT